MTVLINQQTYEQFTTFDGILKESLVIKTTKDNEKNY